MTTSDNVTFEFHWKTRKGYGRYEASEGVVTLDGDTMILEVPYEDGDPYYIVGRSTATDAYEGSHEGAPDDGDVLARWSRLGDRWVGTWAEEGSLYLFTFVLSN